VAGFEIDLRPSAEMDDGTTRHIEYAVRVPLDGLTFARLKHLLAIVGDSPYDGQIRDGRLVLEARRPQEPTAMS
jgi:hypothetical protein